MYKQRKASVDSGFIYFPRITDAFYILPCFINLLYCVSVFYSKYDSRSSNISDSQYSSVIFQSPSNFLRVTEPPGKLSS